MNILWINDHEVSPESVERLRADDVDNVDVLAHDCFIGGEGKRGSELVTAKLDTGLVCILTDSRIWDDIDGGFNLLTSIKDHKNFDRGVVISTDLHPEAGSLKWDNNRRKIWRFRAESTAPDIDICQNILKYFRFGTTSFIKTANEMLRKLEATLYFTEQLTANESVQFIEHWGTLGASLGSSDDSLTLFCPDQAKSLRLFPQTFQDQEHLLGIEITRKQREDEKYKSLMDDWRQILCPFESLSRAAKVTAKELLRNHSGTYGGALRLLFESARKAACKNGKLRPPEALLFESDSIQRDWIVGQYERLDKSIDAFGPDEFGQLLTAASVEVQRSLEILNIYKGDGA